MKNDLALWATLARPDLGRDATRERVLTPLLNGHLL